MSYDIIITEHADADLRGIYEYIAFSLLAPESAVRQLNRLESLISSLDTFPERFRAYENEPWHSRGLRLVPVDKYLILYIPDKDSMTVYIMRVFYQGRDIDTQLENIED